MCGGWSPESWNRSSRSNIGGRDRRNTSDRKSILLLLFVKALKIPEFQSIWLPWGDGAAQGPLQFILSVSRIIIAVLLIVIAPAVDLSFTARGWIGYVIVLLAALMVLMLVGILLVKIVELLFRLIAKVDFDESRSTRNTGLLGALRKKEILGSGRRRRKSKGAHAKRKSQAVHDQTSMRASQTLANTRASLGDPAEYERGYLDPANRLARPSYGREGEDENEHIMSAFQSRPQSMAYTSKYYDAGYVPPGSYAAPSAQQTSSGGFRVVRGGRATDDSPYTMAQSLPPGAAAPPSPNAPPSIATFGADGLPQHDPGRPPMPRARASSQSAIVEEISSSPTSPAWNRRVSAVETGNGLMPHRPDRRLSAPLPVSPSTFPSGAPISSAVSRPTMQREPSGNAAAGWRRESSMGSGFFSSLFRGPTKSEENEDAWSDSDDSDDGDQHRTNAFKRRWFGKGKNKPTSAEAAVREESERYEMDPEWEEALAEDDEEQAAGVEGGEPTSSKGFQVIRKPPLRPRQSMD